jgi:polar amino acid transport system substrate-binding protein
VERKNVRAARAALLVAVVAVLALTVAACGGSSTSSSSATTSKAAAAKQPLGQLVSSGTLHFCSDISSPPLEFYKGGTQATGSDVDLGDAIAARLGLRPVWVNTAFAGIIPALEAGHCDAIMSQLFDKPARRAVVNFVDYMNSSEAVLIQKGNPQHISGIDDLCGHTVAAETGTTVTDYLKQVSQKCAASGKPPISVQTFLRDSDALEQLGLGHVQAYGTTLETGAYDMSKSGGQFAFAGKPFGQIPTGIAVRKNDTQLQQAIAKAFSQIRSDGTYRSIMSKWGLSADMLK